MSDNETTIPLSKRELEVLEMVATGASNQQIARQLVISVNTVKVHLRNIFEKLEAQSRTEAIRRAIQAGWITVAEAPKSGEDTPLPAKTYLLTPQAPALLNRWQQIYLLAAMVLALLVMTLPLMPKTRDRPYLPPLYPSKPPTPVPAPTNSTEWVAQAAMPTQRANLALIAVERRLFAIGGFRGNSKATRLVEIYDSTTDGWSEGAAKPTAAASLAGVLYDGKIYVPGGCTDAGQPLDTLEIYDPQADQWNTGAALPAPRCAYGLTAFKDKLYLFGGWDGQAFVDTVFAYTPTADKWTVLKTALPQAKGYIGAATLNEQIYIVGGYDGETAFNDTHVFKPDRGIWQEKAPLREKRGGLGLISAANSLYAIGGGWEQAGVNNEKYDPKSDTWTTFESPFTHPWHNMGVAATDTQIYAVGGWNSDTNEFMDAVTSYQILFQLFLPISTIGE